MLVTHKRKKMVNQTSSKSENVCCSNDTVKLMTSQATDEEKIFTNQISAKDLYVEYGKPLKIQ